MRRGEFYRVHKPSGDPKLYRTFVIVSRQALIDSRFSTVICAPVFTNGEGLYTEVSVGLEEGLKHSSFIKCDNLASLSKSQLTSYIGSLRPTKMADLDEALRIALALDD